MIANGPGQAPEWVEQGLREALLRDGRKIIETLYNDRNLLPDNAKALAFEAVHRNRARQVHTLFGHIQLRRNYHHHTKSGTGRCPLDDLLGLEGALSPAVARLACRASTCAGSYQQASEDLQAYAAISLNARELERMVDALAPGLEQALGTLTSASQPDTAPIDVLYASCDGTGTPMRREVLKDVKGKQADGSALTREAKLGCIFTQSGCDELGNPLRDPDSTSYVGTYQGCRHIAVKLRQEANRRGLHRARQVVFLGDGAPWVWENCRQTFPDAAEVLDFYHASEHVGQLASAIHDDDHTQAAVLRQRWCQQMHQTSPAGLLAETRKMIQTHPEWSTAKREAIDQQTRYLENNKSRTEYGQYRKNGWFIGSGVVEAGCKHVVGRRLKQSGMFWSQTGAENMLSLRCLVLGPHFDAAWNARRRLLARKQAKARQWKPPPKQAT